MITQIKQWGDSKVIILPPEFMKFHKLKIGDWLDISDIVKTKPKEVLNGEQSPDALLSK